MLRGGCIHHDNGVLGACSFADAEERRVRILKNQGFNALRMAHNPASRSLLDACDRIGMYVMDEAFDGWYIPKEYHDYSRDFLSDYKSVLAAMVENDYNHPSVIMYSLGNEVTETAAKRGIELCAEMRDTVHSLDGTRPVTCGINVLLDVYARLGIGVYSDKKKYKREPLPEGKGYKEKKSGSAFFNYWAEKLGKLFFVLSDTRLAEKAVRDISPALDIVGLNYASSRYDKDAEKYPDRLMIGTETMSADLPYNWNRVLRHKQLIGDFVWSAWDYIGETCMGWTYQSYKGLPLLSGQGLTLPVCLWRKWHFSEPYGERKKSRFSQSGRSTIAEKRRARAHGSSQMHSTAGHGTALKESRPSQRFIQQPTASDWSSTVRL